MTTASEAILGESRRLTPTERLHEVTLTALQRRAPEPESSVTISRNAKGVTQFEVTVRASDPDDAQAKAIALCDELRRRYPLPSGYVGAEGEPT